MKFEVIMPFISASVKTQPSLRSCGVYAIRHRDSGRLYVGSTSRPSGMVTRLSEHRSKLSCGKHANRQLQLAFSKYGANAFDFLVIEYCAADVAKDREQHWLDKLQPFSDGYNVLTNVQDYRPRSAATRAAMSEKASKPYELEFNGEVYSGTNLTAFCEERGLHQGAMTQVLLGKKPQFKGWTLPGNGFPPVTVRNQTTGEEAEIGYFEGTQFARARGLNVAQFNGMLRERYSVCKGWILTSQPRHRRIDRCPQSQ